MPVSVLTVPINLIATGLPSSLLCGKSGEHCAIGILARNNKGKKKQILKRCKNELVDYITSGNRSRKKMVRNVPI